MGRAILSCRLVIIPGMKEYPAHQVLLSLWPDRALIKLSTDSPSSELRRRWSPPGLRSRGAPRGSTTVGVDLVACRNLSQLSLVGALSL